MKLLPNLITLSRIVSALFLIPIHVFSQAFFVVYTYCGVSDILDGILARKLHCSDEFGARLDSIADIVFYTVTAVKILPVLCSKLTPLIWYIIIATLIIRVISYTIAAIKYQCFASLHTYMNKLTGFLVFTIPYIIIFSFVGTACMVIGIVAVIAASEELIIHISTYQYCPDRKTIFALKKCKVGQRL